MTFPEVEAFVKLMRREKVQELQVGEVRILMHVFAYAPEAAPGNPEEPDNLKGPAEPDMLLYSSPFDPTLPKPEEEKKG